MIHFNEIDVRNYSNDKFELLDGYLDEETAGSTLAEFLYDNLGVTTQILSGWRLFPFQELILQNWFDHNFNLAVWSRGGSKSSLVAIFCCLYPIFNPGAKIILASNAFRSTRRLITQIERIINGRNAALLKQCFPMDGNKLDIERRNDEWKININDGFIKALPLNERVRGERADVLIVDEALMVPEDIYKGVLVPFLTAKSNIAEQLRINEQEDSLVASGNLSDEDRTMLETSKKIIALTTASYDFEFICRLYKDWINKVTDENVIPQIRKKYFVSRLSYKALPEELIDEDIIELAKDGGEQTAVFQREFMAQFSSSSDGYFDIKKLHLCTVKDGEFPAIQIHGNSNSKYILAIDPSFSSSKSSDFFAMGVYSLNDEMRILTQVHTYGIAGGTLKDHLKYLYYLLKNFNIVMVIADLGGENNTFIESANESDIFKRENYKLKFIDADFESDKYLEEIAKAQKSYNLTDRRICYRQIFSAQWLRMSNEYLQAQIDGGKIWFGSRISSHSKLCEEIISNGMPVEIKDKRDKEMSVLDYIAFQDFMVDETKKQLALIEVRSTSLGSLQYDLPANLKRSKDPDRARRDNYTCLLMANWGAKCYFDIMFTPENKQSNTFSPMLI